ncbi:dolichol-phosphate mannosyltransferase subunit 3-like isoform X2 [Dermacentor silvarum]|uniref:dolichol-phosphate mannosyltransferase subunit 3-like isoform X2 n=1 Tax=Dermacentor silvarum TaxID=543639 RepID=UPI0021014EDA|nr:dolichol-phosphate mannosyltransferase subunit 3-like isoform X2 [Dermacentor silvarum]
MPDRRCRLWCSGRSGSLRVKQPDLRVCSTCFRGTSSAGQELDFNCARVAYALRWQEPAMTKLMQWLLGLSIFMAIWAALLSQRLGAAETHVWLLPVYACIVFGVYAASVVIYRVLTFNNCEAAAAELKKQIVEAREDLKKRGYKFD